MIVRRPRYITSTRYVQSPAATGVSTSIPYTGGSEEGVLITYAPALYTTSTIYESSSQTVYTSAEYTGGSSPGLVIDQRPELYETSTRYVTSGTSNLFTSRSYSGVLRHLCPGKLEVLTVHLKAAPALGLLSTNVQSSTPLLPAMAAASRQLARLPLILEDHPLD